MPGWDELYADPFWRRWGERPPLPAVPRWMGDMRERSATRVLDMGCGLGRHTVLLAGMGFDVVASDISPWALEATRRRLEESGLRATLTLSDTGHIPYPDDSFDGVLSMGVLEHTTRDGMTRAILEILRVLRPGGSLLASFTPRSEWLPRDDPRHDMLEDNTLRSYGPEQTAHHLVDESELGELFDSFRMVSIERISETFETTFSRELLLRAQKGPGNASAPVVGPGDG